MKFIPALCMACFICLAFPAHKLAKEPDHFILINLATNQLSYFANGQYIRTFPVSTGKKKTPTPEGTFCIVTKYKNKNYHRKNIPGGAMNNPLGTRWMGFDRGEYAIHGTNRESTIGNYESNGCIRMRDRDVQWLYDRVPYQTKVVIATFYGSIERAAHEKGYRVTSWGGQQTSAEQVGRLLIEGKALLYWQDPNGLFFPIHKLKPGESYAVESHDGCGTYHIGHRLYIIDKDHAETQFQQLPRYILINQYKRKRNIP